ncbi:MAG: BMP family ABC transporter substrate-binding protein [Mycoplasma sp.]|nr:BMP family ABC transporter substrate-binding protein [Mycoplasma sp.]
MNRKILNIKKILYIPLVTTPIIYTSSCLSDNVYANTDISSIKDVFSEELISRISNTVESNPILKENIQNQKIILLTTAGKVNDNSFNQMTWEAISEFSRNVGINNSSYKETKSLDSTEIHRSYTNALEKEYNVWILTGFQHQTYFKSWLDRGINRNKFIQNKIKIISIDWDANHFVPEGQGLALNFRTQESSFLVGYVVSKFLANKYPGEENKNKRIVNCSAGADTSGSTNFNYGFLEGIRAWNDEQSSNDTKISSNVYEDWNGGKKVFLSTTYEANNVSTRNDFKLSITGKGNQIFKGDGPTVVMPVAGDWSRTAANIIKEEESLNEKWVVGVDSNMAISYGKTYENCFITSSEKRIGIATYKALCFLTGISTELNDSKINLNEQSLNWEMKDDLIFNRVNNEPSNWSVVGGIDSEFVSASPSTLSNKEQAEEFDTWIKEARIIFFGDGINEGSLAKNKDQAKLNEYYEAQKNPGVNNLTYNQALFNLANVLYGDMTFNNQEYFDMIVEYINKW